MNFRKKLLKPKNSRICVASWPDLYHLDFSRIDLESALAKVEAEVGAGAKRKQEAGSGKLEAGSRSGACRDYDRPPPPP